MKFAWIALAIATLTFARAEDPLAVASLSTILSDLARNVGGTRVVVTDLLKPGVDPHDFQPSPGDIAALSRARVILASGLGFESNLDKLRAAVGGGPVFVVVGDAVKPLMATGECSLHSHDDPGHVHEAGRAVPDPHWWHSIGNAQSAVRAIRDAFIAADPAGRAVYQENTKRYLAKLKALGDWVKLEVARLPKARRVLVTSHNALEYFARDYGFEIYPVDGIEAGGQSSSRHVRDVIEKIRKDQVKALFAENIKNPKVLDEITAATGAVLGGTLYADTLGETEAATYEELMRHNVKTIVDALAGAQAP